MKNKWPWAVIGILCLTLLALSSYLAFFDAGVSTFCGTDPNGALSCNAVQGSRYAEIFGMKVSYFGVFAFSVLLVSFLAYWFNDTNKTARQVFVALCYLGAAFALYFIGLQVFVIQAMCTACIAIDGIMVLTAIVVMIYARRREF